MSGLDPRTCMGYSRVVLRKMLETALLCSKSMVAATVAVAMAMAVIRWRFDGQCVWLHLYK
jgi:hypothetical protein